jgi:hypothetical protein
MRAARLAKESDCTPLWPSQRHVSRQEALDKPTVMHRMRSARHFSPKHRESQGLLGRVVRRRHPFVRDERPKRGANREQLLARARRLLVRTARAFLEQAFHSRPKAAHVDLKRAAQQLAGLDPLPPTEHSVRFGEQCLAEASAVGPALGDGAHVVRAAPGGNGPTKNAALPHDERAPSGARERSPRSGRCRLDERDFQGAYGR